MGIYIFLTILVIIACALVILVVLVQNSKGGSSIERAQDPNAIPVLPTQTPVQGQPDGGNE